MRIFADHASTTPLLPEAEKAALKWIDHGGSPSSLHADGRAAKDAIDEARAQVSAAMGAMFGEVIFTSGGSESAVTAVIGAALKAPDSRRRVLLGSAEHPCVLNTRPILERLGFKVELVPTDAQARVDIDKLAETISDDVCLVSAMQVNNEVGSINDTDRIAGLCREKGALYICDAVQGFPYLKPPDADLVATSAHKIGGMRGAGALKVRAGVKIAPLIAGGGQEREMRGGTENTAAIVAFGAAAEYGFGNREAILNTKTDACSAFFDGLAQSRIEVIDTVSGVPLMPGIVHLRFPGVSAESLLIRLDSEGVSAGSGAACSSGSIEASHVLLAMGMSEEEASEGVRFSFGWSTSVEEAEKAGQITGECVQQILQARRQGNL
jgi:cysteine desulfurase